jgi:hypothetical protein
MLNALCLTILVVFSAAMAFGTMRAWRSKRRMLKWEAQAWQDSRPPRLPCPLP